MELGVLGPLQVRRGGAAVGIPGAKPRAILTMLGLHDGSVVPADTLVELLWGEDPPRTADKALQTHISALRRTLGDGFVLTQGAGWVLADSEVDASRYKTATRLGRAAAAAGDTSQAVARFDEALALWRGIPELPDGRRGTSEKTRWMEGHAALVEDRADALLATGRAAEVIGDLEAAIADAPLRERRWGQLMLALYRAGRQGEALGAYQRARALLADELGVDPGPELRRLEAAIVAQDSSLDIAVAQHVPSVTRAVTFLLTDIEGSTAAWEAEAGAMAAALARHDELIEHVVTSRGGRLIKTRGEGDATFSVFERPSAAASAAVELQDAIAHEPWALRQPIRVRVALHTGEVELRDGDYFGRAVNRVARLRSLAEGGQILCSGATAELVIDSLADDVVLTDLGMRQLRNLARPEHVFELRLETAEQRPQPAAAETPMERPGLPAVLVGPGPFVGRGRELEGLLSAWQGALTGCVRTVLIAGEPGVGKTRLAGEWSQRAYEMGAVVLYGRCDEDLGAPYQPFAEALRALVPCMGAGRLRGLRGIEALLPLVPGLADAVPDLAPPAHADPDTERYALFDAAVALLEIASASAPVLLILDDLHWAAKPTLLLLRHLLRFGDHARVQIVGTYRSTDLDRSHPLAAMLADLHRDGTANRLNLGGLDEDDVTTYVTEAGYDDEELAHALASVTAGNPFFLIEALRHVDESGGVWDQSTLPQGVREAVSRRLSRLPVETNKALAAAAVVGSRFSLELVEQVVGNDLIDAFDEARNAGIVIEEPGGNYRFNHALVRQSLLAELASVRRMRLHQRIATTLEAMPGADDELLAELAHHYFECAWAGNAAKAVLYCRRAADQAMSRLAYEGAADLYHRALHALEELDDELPDRDDQTAELLVARCEALLAAGDVSSAAGAVSQLRAATVDSARLAAWATCFDGQLSMLIHPERLDEVEAALAAAAAKLAEQDDAAGEATAHTVRAGCLARLGRIADCEGALDDALNAARRAREHRRVNAVLAGAPLAALWGPNPVPRAGGRCLDVVRLLRITTDSPAVEATSTRCQAVLEAFRGRAAAARRMIDSARRTVSELGLRHALLEVEQFAGIVELIVDDPAAAESHLRKAYNGFRRMGLDADTAETAALLGRAYLALGRESEADELCSVSERLAGHALKASIAWRTLRAHLLARGNDHDGARRIASEAVALAERTDALVDHGDACFTLATVLGAAGDVAGARAAAEQAVELYERKGAAALAERAREVLGRREVPTPPIAPAPEAPRVELDNACVRAIRQIDAAYDREAWDEIGQHVAAVVTCESRRKIVGLGRDDLSYDEWECEARRLRELLAPVRYHHVVVAVRGERLALTRLEVGPADQSPGAPRDEWLQLYGLDQEGRIALHVFFDLEDMDAALAELDATQARFETEHPRARLENAATRVYERFWSHFAARDWAAVGTIVSESLSGADHRRVVNAGDRGSRESVIEDLQVAADLGFTIGMADVVAIRGERLALTRVRAAGRDPETIQNDAINVVEIDADERLTLIVVYDLDDFDSAIGELDARYLADEAAPYADAWSAITQGYGAFNRRERIATTPDWVNIDHRRAVAVAPGELTDYVHAAWDLEQDVSIYIEAVHRLTNRGAVISHATRATSREGFDAEWRMVLLVAVDGVVNHCEVFDEGDLDVALARFDHLNRPAQRLENAASQIAERFFAYFAACDWDSLATTLADNVSHDDRRHVVNAGVLHGRDTQIANLQAIAEVGITDFSSTVIATRGARLALVQTRSSGPDHASDGVLTEELGVVEINSDNQMAAYVTFDRGDFDSAVAELDARYLAGEAAPYARTWSFITRAYAAVNRNELPAMTPDSEFIDHRAVLTAEREDLTGYLPALWDLTPDVRVYVEAVHRLNELGAVMTHTARGTSEEGFDAEWRTVVVGVTDGDLYRRVEVFDEPDLDAALARFDELHRQAPRLHNVASQVSDRFLAHFAARDWGAMAEMTADDFSSDDRRRVVGAGVQLGRDVDIDNMRAWADVGIASMTSHVIATRGDRLFLGRTRFFGPEQGPDTFHSEVLGLVEIDTENRVVARVVFDADELDAAIAELDARYLAGEASTHSHTWTLVTDAFVALNQRKIPATTSDWVNIDHRRLVPIGTGDLAAYLSVAWELSPQSYLYVAAVHRLSSLGAVITHVAAGTSPEGLDAEWQVIDVMTFEGDRINRCELFDESDLDTALARFDELHGQTRKLENAASRAEHRLFDRSSTHDWAAIAEILAPDSFVDDRRRVVNVGFWDGRDAVMAKMRALAEGLAQVSLTVIATRGKRLSLARVRSFNPDSRREGFAVELLGIAEIDTDGRIAAHVFFDADDIDAAFEELDARYLAGEAAAYAHTWSVTSRANAKFNRHELPATTPDPVYIDHRSLVSIEGVDLATSVGALWDLTSDTSAYIEAVHQLTEDGTVTTQVLKMTSQDGFDAELRLTYVIVVEGNLLSRVEVFEGSDLEVALAHFDQVTCRDQPK
ncbi:BTAD domain-containing putative transcriptional regulator [Mycobacterium paraintracellulare]|uniref:BTAD domain-containing putative transcriptional regulator n=1 Tax=Mycobacterium paraintracellulare TaxID=1138383 RepID=UPI0022AA7B06|nr:BTAD domain-containing putative transcriptional regulator [Mycobacterium paraintracellulare]